MRNDGGVCSPSEESLTLDESASWAPGYGREEQDVRHQLRTGKRGGRGGEMLVAWQGGGRGGGEEGLNRRRKSYSRCEYPRLISIDQQKGAMRHSLALVVYFFHCTLRSAI